MNPGARKGPLWTAAEDAIVRELAPTMEAKDIAVRLPGRSVNAVFHRVARLGIDKRRRWTAADDNRLTLDWGTMTIEDVAAKLGRTVIATYWRAQKLGVGLGVPQGCERFTSAAERCGYAPATLRMILGWAKVPIHRGITRRRETQTTWVDPMSVDDAIRKWHTTETPHAAARRVGLSTGEVVVHRLEASGLPLPRKPRRKRHWRIPSETIDRAMAMVAKRGRNLVVITEAA